MHSIGQLSKMVKISVDALSHYDQIGLFKPNHIHPSTRYRYYTDEQVMDLLAIME
ncbi:MerR family transcriptional regulator [Paenibacillus sp. CF384]|uniref:MerR family transcriptional regulator n=1 Tax=Paenibacillus sp. CF384 TaxID=1884382 RepID=UPI00089D950E|nr:MerR HTH family regulatory protein [Paenibacillus sp. CF384]